MKNEKIDIKSLMLVERSQVVLPITEFQPHLRDKIHRYCARSPPISRGVEICQK